MNKYNNTYYNTIKMKPADNENNTYIDFGKKTTDRYLKFKIGDHVGIS